jgi:hypothetical protein
MQFFFGSGSLHAVNATTNSTPQEFAALQEVSVDFAFSVKELYGKYQMPLAVARGNGKIECKAKMANLNAKLFNELFFADTIATGKTLVAENEAGSIPGSSTYTVTVTNSAHFVEDLGVRYAATGIQLTKVTSPSQAGEYSVASGVYTFSDADKSLGVTIDYSYTSSSSGKSITINNQVSGTTPVFSATLSGTFDSKTVTLKFNKCTSSKLTFGTKQEDFNNTELDFAVMADANGVVGTLSLDE